MGNRAIIAFTAAQSFPATGDRVPGILPAAVYVHWNGGPESVYAVLDVAREIGQNNTVGVSMLYRLFFGLDNELSVYPHHWTNADDAVETADDNGVYVFHCRATDVAQPVAARLVLERHRDADEGRAYRLGRAHAEEEAAVARASAQYASIRRELLRLVDALRREAAAIKAERGEKVPA